MHLLNVSGICKQENGNVVLEDVGFIQQRFRKVAVAGETGSGKSTLLKIIAGLVQPDARGQVPGRGRLDLLHPGQRGRGLRRCSAVAARSLGLSHHRHFAGADAHPAALYLWSLLLHPIYEPVYHRSRPKPWP